MLEIVYGASSNQPAVRELINSLKPIPLDGSLYIGYPVLGTVEGPVNVDALLTTKEHGLVAFDLTSNISNAENVREQELITERHNEIYVLLEQKLKSFKALRKGRLLSFEINVISLISGEGVNKEIEEGFICSPDKLRERITTLEGLSGEIEKALNATIQRTTTMKPQKKRASIVKSTSKGSAIKEIEKQIANLDSWQKKAAIEFPEGPQRIRGLAGSGKTIVLALKASLLHAKFPHWKIVVTFQTRTLYQQFRDLIRRFSFDILSDEPDWENLKILHAWGSPGTPGVYSELSLKVGAQPLSFTSAKTRFGYENAFQGVCRKLLGEKSSEIPELYDLVLIDEAQDFPQPFFELTYKATKNPKRIVWAYDELQNLSNYSMPPAEELFGADKKGKPRVKLKRAKNQPQQDIVLPVCYRNTPWALTLAHSLGFGIYREKGLVQMFDTPSLWEDIGYEIKDGSLGLGRNVSLKRREKATPEYFSEILKSDEAVKIKTFQTKKEEFQWVAEEVRKNIEEDELEKDDILIIHCDPLKIRTGGAKLINALEEKGLTSHLAGVTSSRDKIFFNNSIAITSIFRAKGNEAPMVYVVGGEYCFEGFDLARKRNVLFTAITRSRAWVRISGVGEDMKSLEREAAPIFENNFLLNFKFPTKDQLSKLRMIHRDISDDEKLALQNDMEGFLRLADRVKRGEVYLDQLPKEIQDSLRFFSKKDSSQNDG